MAFIAEPVKVLLLMPHVAVSLLRRTHLETECLEHVVLEVAPKVKVLEMELKLP